ncbi:MAG: hypothetical protein ACK5RO_03425, partial [Pseudobdellovibrionaceae bacterium]
TLFCSDRALSVEICSASVQCKSTPYFESGSYALKCFGPDEVYAGIANNLIQSRGGTWPTSCSNMKLEQCAVFWSTHRRCKNWSRRSVISFSVSDREKFF